jgi:hypothetical protein
LVTARFAVAGGDLKGIISNLGVLVEATQRKILFVYAGYVTRRYMQETSAGTF